MSRLPSSLWHHPLTQQSYDTQSHTQVSSSISMACCGHTAQINIIIIIIKVSYCPTYNKPERPGITESIKTYGILKWMCATELLHGQSTAEKAAYGQNTYIPLMHSRLHCSQRQLKWVITKFDVFVNNVNSTSQVHDATFVRIQRVGQPAEPASLRGEESCCWPEWQQSAEQEWSTLLAPTDHSWNTHRPQNNSHMPQTNLHTAQQSSNIFQNNF